MTNLSLQETLNYYQSTYQIVKKLENAVIQKGFQLIAPSFLENYNRFSGTNRKINQTQMVKLIDSEGNIKVLRPDVTTAIINRLMPKWDNGRSSKVFYNETVFLNTKQGIEEQKQFGVEYLGDADDAVDIEVINLVIELFNTYTLDYQIEVSDASLLKALFDSTCLDDAQLETLKSIIYHKNTFALKQFIEQYLQAYPYKPFISALFEFQGSYEKIRAQLNNLSLPKGVKECFDHLKIYSDKVQSNKITFDLSMLSELDYYHGVIFKGYLQNIPYTVLNGGRYNTASMGYKKNISAMGFSLLLDVFTKEVLK